MFKPPHFTATPQLLETRHGLTDFAQQCLKITKKPHKKRNKIIRLKQNQGEREREMEDVRVNTA